MSDRTELSKDVEDLAVDYLAEYAEEDKSLEGLEVYFIPPTLKKLEANSRPAEVVEEFGAGSIILSPQNDCVWKKDDPPFKFVPILFIPIFRKWLNFDDPEGPGVVETSFDPMSDLAKISRNPGKRNAEQYGNDGYTYQCIEHLTFGGVLYDGNFAGTQCVLSFERSGHFKGKSFLSAIQSRRVTVKLPKKDKKTGEVIKDENGEVIIFDQLMKQPLWSQIWGIELIPQTNKRNQRWFGINFRVVTPSVIDQQYVEPFKKMHVDWKEKQANERIIFDDESTANDVSTDTIVDKDFA